MTQVILSVLYRIANRKPYMVAHHSVKLCGDRDLHIWLLRKRHELRGTLDDRVMEQATLCS